MIGLLLVILFGFSASSDVMQSLERKAYDLGMRATSGIPTDKVVLIAIDERSIENLGAWPWPRATQAAMLDLLSASHAKVIANAMLFSEPQLDPGMEYLARVNTMLDSPTLKSGSQAQQAELDQLREFSAAAVDHLDNDKKLSNSIRYANNVMLPMYFDLAATMSKQNVPLPDDILKNNVLIVRQPTGSTPALTMRAAAVKVPIPALASGAIGIGHINTFKDVDGGVRTEPLVVSYNDQLFPSLALLLAAKSLNLGINDISVNLGSGIRLGKLNITTDNALRMHTFFYRDQQGVAAFHVDSFYDVLSGKIPADKYRDKIVLIGVTATGMGTSLLTPVSAHMPSVILLAHSISSILKQDFIVIPTWSDKAQIGIFITIALYLVVLLPRLGAGLAVFMTTVLLASIVGTHLFLMMAHALWLPMMTSASMLLIGHLLLSRKYFLRTEESKRQTDIATSESNRMLGLAFQGQGQLDMAFDKLRQVDIDISLMEVLYNLGLEFERKREFNKAEAVFKYMAEYNPKFRDLDLRLAASDTLADTLVLGAPSRNSSSIVLGNNNLSLLMLGRYEIDSELGKGAMGVVYLGKDPKIGRVVAIKTMALTQEFAVEDLKDVLERFFREAESAGRLNHPNIVTIYDAGEAHDLAYIAMEFIKGRDLSVHTKLDSLLPIARVLSIVARVADALAYAHRLNVVHRDIKPANIMYDAASDTVKVTDFGIARITDSSKTKTGMVLGSPSYMSPEQLAGTKIEGASDLFSLGVSMYQLLCGKLPFYGDSMAQLMFCIASEPYVDILTIRADLPACIAGVIQKSLAKNVAERYQNGAEMADAIRKCAASL